MIRLAPRDEDSLVRILELCDRINSARQRYGAENKKLTRDKGGSERGRPFFRCERGCREPSPAEALLFFRPHFAEDFLQRSIEVAEPVRCAFAQGGVVYDRPRQDRQIGLQRLEFLCGG